jgi:hypothetical protein
MPLLSVHPGMPAGARVSVELRIVHAGINALKVAEPFDGPDQAATRTARLPRGNIVLGGVGRSFGTQRISMPVWLYRSLCVALADTQTVNQRS